MRAKLAEIAEIALGLSFRGSVTGGTESGTIVVQAKDLSETGIAFDGAARVADVSVKDKFALGGGDVLFQPRGVSYRTVLVTDVPQPAIAAAPLFIIRTKPERLDPAYLAAFISDPETQALLRQKATGTHLPLVSRGVLENLEIPVPPRSKQRAIGALAQLISQKRRLEQEINDRSLSLLRALAFEPASKKPKAH